MLASTTSNPEPMKTLQTIPLAYDNGKSNYAVELLESEAGHLFIQIKQFIDQEDHTVKTKSIQVRPEAALDIANALHRLANQVERTASTKPMRQKIIEHYLKGAKIQDLVLSTGQDQEYIKLVLHNAGIELENEKPYKPPWRPKRRKKR